MNNTLQQLENQNDQSITELKNSDLSKVCGGQIPTSTSIPLFDYGKDPYQDDLKKPPEE